MNYAVAVLLPVLTAAAAIMGFLIAQYVRAEKKGMDSGRAAADLKYVREGVDEIKAEIRGVNEKINCNTERIARVEESTKSAHKRVDKLAG